MIRRILSRFRNLRGPWIADDINEYSDLDHWDGLGATCATCGRPYSIDGTCDG